MNNRLKTVTYLVIVLLGIALALPSLLPGNWLTHTPEGYQQHKVTLGLDLQGGSHLLLEVQTDELVQERTLQIAKELADRMRDAKIRHKRVISTSDGARLDILRAEQLAQAQDIAAALQKELSKEQGHGVFDLELQGSSLLLSPTSTARKALLKDAVERSVEVVRRRIDETGVVEPLVTRQGDRGVLVQLPGVADPARIKDLLGKTARLTFHFVADAQSPTGTPVIDLPGVEASRLYTLEQSPMLEGGDLTDARLAFDPNTQEPAVNFRLTRKGGERFADLTRDNVGRAFAIVLDGKVITAPVIRSLIGGGSGQITGHFSVPEARDLALLLRAGSLPAPLQVAEERTVGPDLGSDAIQMGVMTGLLGAGLILVFMVISYGRWGMIANTALIIYSALVVAALASLGATLTLPGIAGLILSLGMAVDANILINERIREESRRGYSGLYAVHLGFQRAFSTILDSNITTLIAVGLLFLFGAGPIRGFAVTMAMGLMMSMFTSIAVTRQMMEAKVRPLKRNALIIEGWRLIDRDEHAPAVQFLAKRRFTLVAALVLGLASLGLLVQPGLNAGIDFKGGTVLEVHTDHPVGIDALRAQLQGHGDVALQEFGQDNQFLLRMPLAATPTDTAHQITEIKTTLQLVNPGIEFPRVEMVGPSISAQFMEAGIFAVFLASAGMFAFLWVRFEQYFAVAAILTLGFDVALTAGFFALTQLEFNLTAIAAILALIGYSVNDKVVIFDRIRESLREATDMSLYNLINHSVTATLNRTVFTSATTFLAILPMGIAGGDAVASFAVPMLFGIVAGTGSSLFVAAPLVAYLARRAQRVHGTVLPSAPPPQPENA